MRRSCRIRMGAAGGAGRRGLTGRTRPVAASTIGAALLVASLAGIVGTVPGPEPARAQTPELDGPRWTLPVALAAPAPDLEPADADVIVDASGRVHAAWIGRRPADAGGGDALVAATHPDGGVGVGSWVVTTVAAGDDEIRRSDPVVAIDARGGLHIVLVEIDARRPAIRHYHRRPPPNTGWSAPATVSAFGADRVADPAVAADRLGNLHVAWTDERPPDVDVLYRRLRSDGEWDEVQPVHAPREGDQRSPDLAVAGDDAVWAVWEDARDGRAEIWASVLPLASPVWWPDYPLTLPGVSEHAAGPRIAGDGAGGVHAVWLESAGRALGYTARPAGAEGWQAPRTLHRPDRGSAIEVDVAGGAGGRVMLAWSESRPGESRLYSGLLAADGRIELSRIDRIARYSSSRFPALALGSDPLAHVVWTGLDGGRPAAMHATAALEAPARERRELRGRLRFDPRVDACHGERYVIEDCAGTPLGLARSSGVDLAPLLGRDVVVSGPWVDDGPCEFMLADSAALAIGPCPRTRSSVTGIVLLEEVPVEGAQVKSGVSRAITGASGRFFLDDLDPGTRVLTATLPCALSNIAPRITVNPRQTLRMEPAHLWAGDVVEDCRIDARDLTRMGAHYRASATDGTIGRCTDIDADGVVGAADLALVASRLGRACAHDWRVEDPIFDAADALGVLADRIAPGVRPP